MQRRLLPTHVDEHAAVIHRELLEEAVNWIRLERCQDETKVKLLVRAKSWTALPLIKKAFLALGDIEHLKGTPPSGWLKDEVATWLEALQ